MMDAPTAEAFTVGIVYVKPLEFTAIAAMLDEEFDSVPVAHGDQNEYMLGRIGDHNVAIVGPARGQQGTVATAQLVSTIHLTFPNISVGLLVGIGGGIPHYPEHDVRLGDVVVGAPESGPAVVQYDLGHRTAGGFETTRTLAKPPPLLLKVVTKVEVKMGRLKEGQADLLGQHLARFSTYPRLRESYQRPSSRDRLFDPTYLHADGTQCDGHSETSEYIREPKIRDAIVVHYSTILSGNSVMKSSEQRDALSKKYNDALCFEMEAAGLMDVFSCLVIRGICDYSDSHKNYTWQKYAAGTAAAYAREILLNMSKHTPRQPEMLNSIKGSSSTENTHDLPHVSFSGPSNYGTQVGSNMGGTVTTHNYGGMK